MLQIHDIFRGTPLEIFNKAKELGQDPYEIFSKLYNMSRDEAKTWLMGLTYGQTKKPKTKVKG